MGYDILIVDDSSFMRTKLSKILETIPEIQKIHEAENGILAIDMYKKIKPDLVTMDIDMPNMDGFKSTKEIMNFDPKAKIVIVTSVDKVNTRDEAEDVGAWGFINKPFQKEEISELINEIPIIQTSST